MSQFLAEKLKLPKHVTDEIHKKQHSQALEWLYEVIHEFVNRLEPRLTWRLIIQALRSPLIHLPFLAKRWRGNHCPTPKTPNGIIILLLYPPVLYKQHKLRWPFNLFFFSRNNEHFE